MALHVGAVKITYLDFPKQLVRDFLWQLADGDGNEDWGGAWEGNALLEMSRRRMLSKARSYARKEGFSPEDSDKLIAWIRELPWDGDTITLHLNW